MFSFVNFPLQKNNFILRNASFFQLFFKETIVDINLKPFTFALMITLYHKRKWASILLLAVFVPMLMLSSMHHHKADESGEKACVECLHHVHHSHIGEQSVGVDGCLLCQFLSLPFIAATTLVFTFSLHFLFLPKVYHRSRCLRDAFRMRLGRAPPFYLAR